MRQRSRGFHARIAWRTRVSSSAVKGILEGIRPKTDPRGAGEARHAARRDQAPPALPHREKAGGPGPG